MEAGTSKSNVLHKVLYFQVHDNGFEKKKIDTLLRVLDSGNMQRRLAVVLVIGSDGLIVLA